MTLCLAEQTLTPAPHKIALPAREKLPHLTPEKTLSSRRPALYFIAGIKTLPNTPFFPPIPPSLRLFGALIVMSPTHTVTIRGFASKFKGVQELAFSRAIIGESNG